MKKIKIVVKVFKGKVVIVKKVVIFVLILLIVFSVVNDEVDDGEFVEGQFVKKKDIVILIDEFCLFQGYQVYVDLDFGMIYDVLFNQFNVMYNNNKFYCD